MRETLTLDRHGQHAWLHFAIRFFIVFLLIVLLLVLAEHSVGQPSRQGPAPAEIMEAEQRLSDLGYWTGPVDGGFDESSRHALLAFQKIEGRKRTGKFAGELEALKLAARPEPRDSTYPHIEIDLERQVLKEDFGLVVAGVASFLLIVRRNRRARASTWLVGPASQGAPGM